MGRLLRASCAVFCLLGIPACFQVQNSFENDATLYRKTKPLDLNNSDDLALQDVRAIFTKYNCVSCHAGNTSNRFQGLATYTNHDWLTRGCLGAASSGEPCVKAGFPASSYIYKKLQKSTCAATAKLCNMPLTADIDAEDVAVIENWIEGL